MLLNVALAALVFALVQAAPTPEDVVRDEVRRVILEKARQTGQPPREVARQLLGGGDDYAPYQVPCPDASSTTWVRAANGLGTGETNYLSQRRPYLESAIQTQLSSHGIAQPPRTPVIGFALSGGGYRAMQVGLGGVMGTMNASSEAKASGTGGWFDAVTYMAGLSGGSWATATLMANDGQLPTRLVDDVWNLESNLVVPDDGKLSFYYDLVSNVRAKANAGFPTQITDYWGLALANHLLPEQYHLDNSPNYTYSSLPSTVNGLKNGSLPMPIIIAAEREPGELVVAENATVWELTPYEFGAWAFGNNTKVQGAFTPMEYLGTPLNNGQPNGTTCWKGFDQLSFVMGTSSTLFNSALIQLTTANASGIIVDAIQSVLQSIGEQENDVARYPNSFAGWNSDNNPVTDLEYLTLVDAGETNQNLPIEPLLTPYRGVDAILAFDSSADTEYSWPNGSALRTTYERAVQLALQQDVGIRMPRVPTTNGFINGGYNTRPTFFGCEANGTTPIIVYVPNYPWSYYGNTSTFLLEYEKDQSEGVINNGMRSFTLNGTVASWPKCLACALSDRAFNYTTANRTAECQECFNTWCWDGTDNDTAPSTSYAPVLGSVPAFLTQNNLVNSSSGSPAPSASSSSPATTSSVSSSNTSAKSGAERRAGSTAGLVLASVTAVLGGFMVLA